MSLVLFGHYVIQRDKKSRCLVTINGRRRSPPRVLKISGSRAMRSEQGLSFFNQVWKKHTSFSQSVEQHHIDGPTRNSGLSSIKLQKNGDLLGYTYFSISNGAQAQDHANWEQLIESVEWVIGGVVVDTQDSVFTKTSRSICSRITFLNLRTPRTRGRVRHSYFYPTRSILRGNGSAIPGRAPASGGLGRPHPLGYSGRGVPVGSVVGRLGSRASRPVGTAPGPAVR